MSACSATSTSTRGSRATQSARSSAASTRRPSAYARTSAQAPTASCSNTSCTPTSSRSGCSRNCRADVEPERRVLRRQERPERDHAQHPPVETDDELEDVPWIRTAEEQHDPRDEHEHADEAHVPAD